ncbi:MAG: GntR family transcriptional regulator [Chloroflexi bacterium]|nr:GntR family transcriptional regulator [Chloroflexota bacterium]
MAIQYLSKVDLAYQEIRRQIVDGELGPGERLLIQNMAHQLGTSAGPVRESFRRLEAEGLVIIHPHVGATVAPLDLDDLWVSILMLSALGGLAARLAADPERGLAGADLAAIERTCQAMDKCVRTNSLDDFHRLNNEFHRTIYGAARSKRLASTIDNLFQTVGIARHVFEDIAGYAAESNAEHAAIVAALKAHDLAGAEARMKAHIEAAGRRRIAYLRNHRQDASA